MILVIAGATDPHGAAVIASLKQRGVWARLLDFADFPSQILLRYEGNSGSLRGPDWTLDLAQIECVFWRYAKAPQAPAGLRRDLHPLALRETRRALDMILGDLSCPIVNPPQTLLAHRHKPSRSNEVKALGMAVPETLTTNDPAAVRAFYAQHEAVVVKPIGGGAYARLLEPKDLLREDSIRACPMQYQRYIVGEDLRVFVVEEEVFAGRILRSNTGPIDFRRDPTHRAVAMDLDEGTAALCRRIARSLGLCFTALDLRRTPAGQVYFLEANPSPMFLRFCADTGHRILPCLVELLVSRRGQYRMLAGL